MPPKYKPPMSGRESHMSGMEIVEHKAYESREQTRLRRLKTMKSRIDNRPPPQFTHILSNRKKQMQNVDRFSEIERENFRLLSRMSTIMTKQPSETSAVSCPALDKVRQRDRANRQVAGENAVMMQRITKVKSFYNASEWNSSMMRHDSALNYLCKYPRVLAPLSDTGIWYDEEAVNRTKHSRGSSPDRLRSNSALPILGDKSELDDSMVSKKGPKKIQRPETVMGLVRNDPPPPPSRRGGTANNPRSASAAGLVLSPISKPSIDAFDMAGVSPSGSSGSSLAEDDDGFSPPKRKPQSSKTLPVDSAFASADSEGELEGDSVDESLKRETLRDIRDRKNSIKEAEAETADPEKKEESEPNFPPP